MNGKRAYNDISQDDDNGGNELEEGEEQEQHLEQQQLRYPSSLDDATAPPPPPPVLRLVVYHSSSVPSANLLPTHQTLAIITETTSIGRDRSYDPRIRLKSLEVSKTHATLYYSDSDGTWCILDNASTHGTFVRSEGAETYMRLSEKGATSLPRVLEHLDTIKIGNQRFIVHLHPAECCAACSESHDGKNIVPLVAGAKTSASTSADPGAEHPSKRSRTKEEKWQDHKQNMKSLRTNLLSKPTTPSSRSRRTSPKEDQAESSTASIGVQLKQEQPSQPQYVDRARLRRSMFGSSLSDAQPAQRAIPFRAAASVSTPPPAPEPSYGVGQALYAKMVSSSAAQRDEDEARRMGKVIEVRTTDRKGAGLGSGQMREGVENVGQQGDWRYRGKERRWQETFRQ